MLAGVESIMRRHGQPRYVVICSELDNRLVLEAMQIGARHCLVKSALESDLVPVLRRLLEGVEGLAPRASGQVITVMTASGGAGAHDPGHQPGRRAAHELGAREPARRSRPALRRDGRATSA